MNPMAQYDVKNNHKHSTQKVSTPREEDLASIWSIFSSHRWLIQKANQEKVSLTRITVGHLESFPVILKAHHEVETKDDPPLRHQI